MPEYLDVAVAVLPRPVHVHIQDKSIYLLAYALCLEPLTTLSELCFFGTAADGKGRLGVSKAGSALRSPETSRPLL
jgi:hypothetical protein